MQARTGDLVGLVDGSIWWPCDHPKRDGDSEPGIVWFNVLTEDNRIVRVDLDERDVPATFGEWARRKAMVHFIGCRQGRESIEAAGAYEC